MFPNISLFNSYTKLVKSTELSHLDSELISAAESPQVSRLSTTQSTMPRNTSLNTDLLE